MGSDVNVTKMRPSPGVTRATAVAHRQNPSC